MATIESLATIVGVLLLGTSAYLVWSGFNRYQQGSAIADAVPFDAASTMRDLVVVDGIVDGPLDGAHLESGMSATPCVAYSERRITKKSHGKEDVRRASSGQYRKRVKERTGAIPFILNTASGAVRVDGSDARVEVPDDEHTPVSMEDVRENRGMLIGLWWLIRSVLTHADREYHREYEEACFTDGDPLLAIGSLDGTDTSDALSLRPGGDAPLVITSQPHADVAETFRSGGKSRLVKGALVLLIGGIILAAATGLV